MIKVYANYGAMHPVTELVVISLDSGVAKTQCGQTININDVRDSRPATGSPIGLYWNEMDAF